MIASKLDPYRHDVLVVGAGHAGLESALASARLGHGVDATGVEGSSMAIARSRHPEKIHRHDLN